jgi:outer membrane protein OmpU
MNNLKKVGLTALAGSLAVFSVAQADLVLSGSAEATYTTSDITNTGNGFGLSNEFTLTGTGEMDNGFTYTAHTNFAGQDMGTDSNYLKVDMGAMGTVSLDQGSEQAGISKMVNFGNPSAYEEAGHGVSTLGDKLDNNWSGAIGYNNTMMGVTVSIEVNPTTAGASKQAGSFTGAGATASNANYSLKYAVDGVDGLSVMFGQSQTASKIAGVADNDEMSAGVRYTQGDYTVGLQRTTQQDGTAGANGYEVTQYGISYNVNENLSVSYNAQDVVVDAPSSTNVTEESEGVSAAYSMGSASVRFSYNEAKNQGGVLGVKDDNTELSLSLAF